MKQASGRLGGHADRRRAAALAVAIGAHALFIAALVWQAPWRDEERGAPHVVELDLTSNPMAPHPAKSLPRATFHPLTASRPEPPTVARQSPETPVAMLPPSQPASAPTTTPSSEAPVGDAGKALRGAMGCSFAAMANLTQDERQHCQDRLVQNRDGEPGKTFGVDPAKQAFFAANAKRTPWWTTPFLATTPKKGCAPKVTNQQTVVGGRGMSEWRAGVSCGWSF